MAVTTWSPGQVLAAQDLNDTFASKLDATSYTAPGLEYIDGDSVSTVSSVGINGCFTSTHENYVVVCHFVGSVETGIFLRLRASGADDTGTNYDRMTLGVDGSSVTGSRSTGQTSYTFGVAETSRTHHSVIHVFRPQIAAVTGFFSTDIDGRSDIRYGNRCCYHVVTNAYDGFSITANTGTISGSVRVYGYKNT